MYLETVKSTLPGIDVSMEVREEPPWLHAAFLYRSVYVLIISDACDDYPINKAHFVDYIDRLRRESLQESFIVFKHSAVHKKNVLLLMCAFLEGVCNSTDVTTSNGPYIRQYVWGDDTIPLDIENLETKEKNKLTEFYRMYTIINA